MIILQFFPYFYLRLFGGGDHKRVSLDFRDQTPPKDSGLFKTGVWIFSSKKLTKFGPFRQFFNGVKKEKLFGLHFSTENRHKLEVLSLNRPMATWNLFVLYRMIGTVLQPIHLVHVSALY